MAQPAHLRVILSDIDVQKLTLPPGIPQTVEELHSLVQVTFGIPNFCLHFKDADFGDEFFSLLSTTDIVDKGTIKVVYINEPPTLTLTLTDIQSSFTTVSDSLPSDDVCSSASSHDTLLLTESPTQRSKLWPAEFPVPCFSANTEILLQSGNEKFVSSGILFGTKDLVSLLPDILGNLAETIFEYTAYPSSAQLSFVAEALVKKHPCLKEPGSFNGCYGWLQRLKYKMNNFRSKLRGTGCPEVVVNSLKRKASDEQTPAKNVKKPKKAEVNYLPPFPQGQTSESLEKERVELLCEVMKKENGQVVVEKMAKTFCLRRREIIHEAPTIRDFMQRWPALFDTTQINEEFKRITTVNLEATFMAKLDQCIEKLMDVVSSRGGASGARIRQIKNLLQHNTIEVRREVAIRCLVVFLGEKEEDLFEEFGDNKEFENGIDGQMMKIAIVGDRFTSLGSDCWETAIVVEGTKCLVERDISRSCALLMGIIYALNLSYNKKLKYTFEVFQKLFLDLDGLRGSAKVMGLKNIIF